MARLEWADACVDALEPTQDAVRAFDATDDGARFREIVGMTMWENLGGDSLPYKELWF